MFVFHETTGTPYFHDYTKSKLGVGNTEICKKQVTNDKENITMKAVSQCVVYPICTRLT